MERKTGDGAALPSPTITADSVAAYLRQHPEFLLDHPELVGALVPPNHASGDHVVDFGRFLVDRLRAEIATLRAREARLITTVENNVAGQGRIHRACLKLLDAATPADFARTIRVDLLAILDVAAARLCLDPKAALEVFDEQDGVVRMGGEQSVQVLPPGREAVLRRAEPADRALFGDAGNTVGSVALIRLVTARGAPPGFLALGSGSPDGFQPTQATDLLLFLARVAETRLCQWLTADR